MVGLAILSGLRRGEIFALRWQDIDEESDFLIADLLLSDRLKSERKTSE